MPLNIPRDGDPVGATEIATLFDVKPQTVAMWQHRNLMPPPDWQVGGRPAWRWETVREWGVKTGRAERAAFPLTPALSYDTTRGLWRSADRSLALSVQRLTPGRPGTLDRWSWQILVNQQLESMGSWDASTTDPNPYFDGLYSLAELFDRVRGDLEPRTDFPDVVRERVTANQRDLIGVRNAVLNRAEFLAGD